jgi:hypothetical protein
MSKRKNMNKWGEAKEEITELRSFIDKQLLHTFGLDMIKNNNKAEKKYRRAKQ